MDDGDDDGTDTLYPHISPTDGCVGRLHSAHWSDFGPGLCNDLIIVGGDVDVQLLSNLPLCADEPVM